MAGGRPVRAEIADSLTTSFGSALLDGNAAAPTSVDQLAALCAWASTNGWRWRISGSGTWGGGDTPADLELSTRHLRQIIAIAPDDLVVTVEAGVTLSELATALVPHRLWWPVDPPGGGTRSIGSVVATATAGPLRHGYGPVRDQVLGCTVVTADGRLVETGGRVVKNVAGFDLPRLHAGGFGAFGVIVLLHLRLRALPERDLTLVAGGARHDLLAAAHAARESGIGLCALELLSPGAAGPGEWSLAARLAGTGAGIEGEAARLRTTTGLPWRALTAGEAAGFWSALAAATGSGATTFRLGCLTSDVEDTLRLIDAVAGAGVISAGAASGQVRCSGEMAGAAIARLREQLASREVPLTIERSPWPIRRAEGHYGALRTGVGPLTGKLRALFDPHGSIAVALEGEHG
jgi:glycolate oxidase FAD binding subunit